MPEGCDCAARLFGEVKEYIKYKISSLDIYKYLSSQGDAVKLYDQVDYLLADLDYQFKYVLYKLTVTDALEEEIDGQYRILQAKYDDIVELPTDYIEKALVAIEQTYQCMYQIQRHREELGKLQAQSCNPQEFYQQCVRYLDQLGKRLSEADYVVKSIYDQVYRYTSEHYLLESQVIYLFKH